MKIDRDKTVSRILNSDFPANLLAALVSLDIQLDRMEKVSSADEEVTGEMVQNLIQSSVSVINEFRHSWAVYEDEALMPIRDRSPTEAELTEFLDEMDDNAVIHEESRREEREQEAEDSLADVEDRRGGGAEAAAKREASRLKKKTKKPKKKTKKDEQEKQK